jgi:hypothetical protein
MQRQKQQSISPDVQAVAKALGKKEGGADEALRLVEHLPNKEALELLVAGAACGQQRLTLFIPYCSFWQHGVKKAHNAFSKHNVSILPFGKRCRAFSMTGNGFYSNARKRSRRPLGGISQLSFWPNHLYRFFAMTL